MNQFHFVLAALACFGLSGTTYAATQWWDGEQKSGLQAGPGTWSTTDISWNNSDDPRGNRVEWVNGNDAIFEISGTSAVTVSGAVTAGSMTFNGTGYAIGGTTLTLNASAVITANADAIINAPLAGAGVNLTKAGDGTLTLGGANAHTGTTTITSGTLVAANPAALGSSHSIIVNGGNLQSSVATIHVGELTLGSGTLSLGGSSGGTAVLAANAGFTMSGGMWSLNLAANTDQIHGSGQAVFAFSAGTLDLGGGAINYGSTYDLLSGFASGSVAGLEFTGYDSSNYRANLSSSGELSFSSTPEPGNALVGLVLAAGLLRRKRS